MSSFQVYNTILTMLYIESPERIPLLTGSLYPLTNIFPFPPLPSPRQPPVYSCAVCLGHASVCFGSYRYVRKPGAFCPDFQIRSPVHLCVPEPCFLERYLSNLHHEIFLPAGWDVECLSVACHGCAAVCGHRRRLGGGESRSRKTLPAGPELKNRSTCRGKSGDRP